MLDTSKPLVMTTKIKGMKRARSAKGEKAVFLPAATYLVEITIDLDGLAFEIAGRCLMTMSGQSIAMSGAIKAKVIEPK